MLDHLGGDARRAQARGVGVRVAAQPQRALAAHQRLAGARRPFVPQRPRGHGIADLLRGRVQVPEPAGGAGGLPAARLPTLQDDDVGAAARERVSRGEADDPGPHHGDVRTHAGTKVSDVRGRVRQASKATISATPAMIEPKSSNVGRSPSGVTSTPAAMAGTEIAE